MSAHIEMDKADTQLSNSIAYLEMMIDRPPSKTINTQHVGSKPELQGETFHRRRKSKEMFASNDTRDHQILQDMNESIESKEMSEQNLVKMIMSSTDT